MRISVLIVTRDRPQVLRRCLKSIFDQTYSDKEVCVFDDGSTYGNVEEMLAENFGSQTINYQYVDKSAGATRGRNRLAENAQGDILCFLDDDAYFKNDDALEHVVSGFKRHDKMGVAAFKIIDYRKKDPRLLLPFSRFTLWMKPELKKRPNKVSYYLGCGFAVEKEVFKKAGGFTSFLYYGEDELDFSYRVLEENGEIRYLPDVLVDHVPGPSLLTDSRGRNKSYYHVRNRIYLLYRYIPSPYAAVYAVIWTIVRLSHALRDGELGSVMRGVSAGLSQMEEWKRDPVGPDSVAYLKQNHGRLWY